MSEEYPMLGVENILDCFDIDRAYQLIQNQLKSDENSPSGTLTDHLKPMWVRYKNIEIDKDQGITTDVIGIVNTRFDTICTMFIDAIITRYGITIDVGWLENQNKNTLHSLALVLYSFFVLDLESNIKEVLYKYILDNYVDLALHFGENLKSRKDSPYLAMRKTMEPEYAIIASSMNDVCYWILDQMDNEEFLSYLDSDYIPQPIVKELFDDGHMDGNFVEHIYEYFKSNTGMKYRIVFDIISLLKTNHKIKEKEDEE